ncbi:MAG TPA: glycosyltransferase family 9 protein, partial [Bacteroidota bacterium]|nr:glycosyltransferase family 9 protein [Bacteroidota bacterium]
MPSYNRILISRMKFIGDVVLTTPIIRAVREKYPDAYIAYLGDKLAVSLLENNPYLDEIIPFDFSKPTFLEQSRVMLRLRKRRFDVFVDLFSNPRTALLARASSASIRIGKDVKGRGKLYTHC